MVRQAVRQAHGPEQSRRTHHPEPGRRAISKFQCPKFLNLRIDSDFLYLFFNFLHIVYHRNSNHDSFIILSRQQRKIKAVRKILTGRQETSTRYIPAGCWRATGCFCLQPPRQSFFSGVTAMDQVSSGLNLSRALETALLWVMSPLVILISINLLVIWVAVAGFEFR
jgi:hypothetical protein